ncbi:1369_t:CDS:2, partial [Acaulospora colombiana]
EKGRWTNTRVDLYQQARHDKCHLYRPTFVSDSTSLVVLLDDIINVADGRADEQGEDERDYVVVVSPNVDIDGVEDCQEREAPSNAVNGDLLARVGELVDDITEQQKVDERPDDKGPACRGEIRLLCRLVHVAGSGNRINVAAEEKEVDNDVDNLEPRARKNNERLDPNIEVTIRGSHGLLHDEERAPLVGN